MQNVLPSSCSDYIAEPVVVSATISVTTPLSCGAGNATQSATVTAVGAGGNAPYQYNFNNQGFKQVIRL
jgi:hypothetical protein